MLWPSSFCSPQNSLWSREFYGREGGSNGSCIELLGGGRHGCPKSNGEDALERNVSASPLTLLWTFLLDGWAEQACCLCRGRVGLRLCWDWIYRSITVTIDASTLESKIPSILIFFFLDEESRVTYSTIIYGGFHNDYKELAIEWSMIIESRSLDFKNLSTRMKA